MLRYQYAGKDGGGDGGEKAQVEKVVDARAGGLRSEQAAAERGDPAPGKQQVSENHARHGESEPLVEEESGERNSRQRADGYQQRNAQPEGYLQAPLCWVR